METCVLQLQARELFKMPVRGKTMLPGVEQLTTIPLIAEVDLEQVGHASTELQDSDYEEDDALLADGEVGDDESAAGDGADATEDGALQHEAAQDKHQLTLHSFFSRIARDPQGLDLEILAAGGQGSV